MVKLITNLHKTIKPCDQSQTFLEVFVCTTEDIETNGLKLFIIIKFNIIA